MTLCIAALADDRHSIVMAADRMVSLSFIESELDISKLIPLGDNWWVMVAANALSNLFPVVDAITRDWEPSTGVAVDSVMEKATAAYSRERQARVEAEHLRPRGLGLQTFLASGRQWLPELAYAQIDDRLTRFNLGITLLICGFDESGIGHIFTVENPGVADRRDIPGFHAIGSGFYGAEYMMYYRELGYSFPVHKWLYYIYEAKGFGEQAGAVGLGTELFVARPNQTIRQIDDDGYSNTLDRLWAKMRPADGGILKKCVNSQAVYPLSEQDGLKARERR